MTSLTNHVASTPLASSTSSRWRVAAKPAQLLTLSARADDVAEGVRFAAARCRMNPHINPSGIDDIARALTNLSESVRRVGVDLDAADLSNQLRRVSNSLVRTLRSRSLLVPSIQARLLGKGDRKYLRVDTDGHGRVVEITGDLQHARHIAVIVPGMTNSLADYDPNTRKKGRNLAAAMRALDPHIAVVTWLGYRTPDLTARHPFEGAGVGLAQAGARELLDDLEVLRRMAPHAHLSLIGHSYGTVLLGQAMTMRATSKRLDATGVTDVVSVGSPGMHTRSRKALGHPKMDLWATKAPADLSWHLSLRRPTFPRHFTLPALGKGLLDVILPPVMIGPVGLAPITITPPHPVDLIPMVPLHGEDPAAKGFGAKRFSSGGATDHGTYFEPNTVSLENLARIATDRPTLVG